MDLLAASSYFDDIEIADAYTGEIVFLAQVGAVNSAGNPLARLKVLSTAPGTSLPSRRAATWFGETWLLGEPLSEGLQNQMLRTNTPLKYATDKLAVLTPGMAASGSVTDFAYAHREYLKDITDSQSNSEYDAFLEITFSYGEGVAKGRYLRNVETNEVFRVRSTHKILEGYDVAACDTLEAAVVVATFSGAVYDPITDSYTGSGSAVNSLLIDGYKLYGYTHPAAPLQKAGDKTLVVNSYQVTPKVGTTVQIAGKAWQVQAFSADQDAWNLHIRLA